MSPVDGDNVPRSRPVGGAVRVGCQWSVGSLRRQAAWSRLKREKVRERRDREIRVLLEDALRRLGEGAR